MENTVSIAYGRLNTKHLVLIAASDHLFISYILLYMALFINYLSSFSFIHENIFMFRIYYKVGTPIFTTEK